MRIKMTSAAAASAAVLADALVILAVREVACRIEVGIHMVLLAGWPRDVLLAAIREMELEVQECLDAFGVPSLRRDTLYRRDVLLLVRLEPHEDAAVESVDEALRALFARHPVLVAPRRARR